MWCVARDSAVLGGLVRSKGIIVLLQWLWEWQYSVQREAIPPVVARIFSGDSTSPLTREARVLAVFEGWCGFGRVGCVARDYCPFAMVAGIERFDATGGASKARMPEMNAQRLCRTQSQQSVHKEARMP